jgi:hypothetical protein
MMWETEVIRLTPLEEMLVKVRSRVEGDRKEGAVRYAWCASLESCASPLHSRFGTA